MFCCFTKNKINRWGAATVKLEKVDEFVDRSADSLMLYSKTLMQSLETVDAFVEKLEVATLNNLKRVDDLVVQKIYMKNKLYNLKLHQKYYLLIYVSCLPCTT